MSTTWESNVAEAITGQEGGESTKARHVILLPPMSAICWAIVEQVTSVALGAPT